MNGSRAKRVILWAAGCLALAAGIIGIFVPLWPTTCFLLASAACFSRSSERLYRWMTANRWFGRHLARYREDGTVDARLCRASLRVLWPTMAASLLLTSPPLWVWLAVAGIGAAVTAHLWSLARRTAPESTAGAGHAQPLVQPGAGVDPVPLHGGG